MPYSGATIMGRQVVELIAHAEDPNGKLVMAQRKIEGASVLCGESGFSVGAYHDNFASVRLRAVIERTPELLEGRTVVQALDHLREREAEASEREPATAGELSSRDCGLGQINIPARLVGTPAETRIRTEDKDPLVYMPVARANLDEVARLYASLWRFPNGALEPRQWQAWVAATSGWPWYPEFYCWHREAGQPVGPWVPTGRFLHKAIRAVANWHLVIAKDQNPAQALTWAKKYAKIYGITKGELAYDDKQLVHWRYPPAPTAPPADPWAAYPKPNDGRSPLTVMVNEGKLSAGSV